LLETEEFLLLLLPCLHRLCSKEEEEVEWEEGKSVSITNMTIKVMEAEEVGHPNEPNQRIRNIRSEKKPQLNSLWSKCHPLGLHMEAEEEDPKRLLALGKLD
jgi:hypothetical protein